MAGISRDGSVQGGIGLEINRRRVERRNCSVAARARFSHGEVACRIINISTLGIGFVADQFTRFGVNERITISAPQTGELDCIVRWASHPRYGAEFAANSKIPDAFHQLYDSLPPVSD